MQRISQHIHRCWGDTQAAGHVDQVVHVASGGLQTVGLDALASAAVQRANPAVPGRRFAQVNSMGAGVVGATVRASRQRRSVLLGEAVLAVV